MVHTTAESARDAGVLQESEQLIEELDAADILVISTPMHNFTVPAVLKAWIDQVGRFGRTFQSTPTGKVGLLRDRPGLYRHCVWWIFHRRDSDTAGFPHARSPRHPCHDWPQGYPLCHCRSNVPWSRGPSSRRSVCLQLKSRPYWKGRRYPANELLRGKRLLLSHDLLFGFAHQLVHLHTQAFVRQVRASGFHVTLNFFEHVFITRLFKVGHDDILGIGGQRFARQAHLPTSPFAEQAIAARRDLELKFLVMLELVFEILLAIIEARHMLYLSLGAVWLFRI